MSIGQGNRRRQGVLGTTFSVVGLFWDTEGRTQQLFAILELPTSTILRQLLAGTFSAGEH